MYFINIIGFQTILQIRLEETARQINTSAYLTADTKPEIYETSFLSKEIIHSIFFTDSIKTLCDSTYVKGGANGLSFFHSTINTDTMTADLILTYQVAIPFLPDNLVSVPFTQHCKFKLFTGQPVSVSKLSDDTLVYLTTNASVYHTDKYCTYLTKYSEAVYKDDLSAYIEEKKLSLTPCKLCSRIPSYQNTTIYYLTTYGNTYHYSRDCHYLNCGIYSYHYSDVKGKYPLCSRCAANRKTNTN
jgi:hypothetical protein